MRTTIDIPEPLLRRAQAAASLDGKSLRAYVTEALEQRLAYTVLGGTGHRVSLPLVPSKTPGALRITEDSLARALADEDVTSGRDSRPRRRGWSGCGASTPRPGPIRQRCGPTRTW